MRIPIPKEDEVPLIVLVEKADEWVKWYLNCPPWMCQCGLKNFGRNKKCAVCKQPRPSYYVENEYEGISR